MENAALAGIVILAVMLPLLLTGANIFTALGMAGIIAIFFFMGPKALQTVGTIAWSSLNSFTLPAVPLFIVMAELLARSRVLERAFRAMTPWVLRLPGRLFHIATIGSLMFGALSPSAFVSTATISAVLYPQLSREGYDKKTLAGLLVSAGPLGFLVPPSLTMIFYGMMTQESVGDLFIAGILPAVLIALLFMIYTGVKAWRNPGLVPIGGNAKLSIRESISGLKDIVPIVVVVILVMGSIYSGLATPTESAGIGAIAAVVISLIYRKKLTWTDLKGATLHAARMTSAVILILVGAQLVGLALATLGVSSMMVEFVAASHLSISLVLVMLFLLYFVLGMFIDVITMILLTMPVVYPLLQGLGIDLIWFGVVLTILCCIGTATPPVGSSLYAFLMVTRDVSMEEILRGIIPFLLLQVVAVGIIITFPEIATILVRGMP